MPGYSGSHSTDPMIHGGDHFGLDIRLDFSVNTNPCADGIFSDALLEGSGQINNRQEPPALFSRGLFEDAAIRAGMEAVREAGIKGLKKADQYPDLHCRKLKAALSELEKIQADQILCGNGASELFMAIVHAAAPKKALVLAPCYSGYERALVAVSDCEVRRHYLKEENGFVPDESLLEDLTPDLDLFFLAVPNNPTGKMVDAGLLAEIKAICRKQQILLVLDACFYPFVSGKPLAVRDAVIVKAFTKTVSLPGLRMGYLIARDAALYEKIRLQLPEWNVSAVAMETGIAAAKLLTETGFMQASRKYVETERKWLAQNLKNVGLTVFDSDVNYLLVKSDASLYEKLLAEQILVRDCSSFSGLGKTFVRFAVRSREENEQLVDSVRRVLFTNSVD